MKKLSINLVVYLFLILTSSCINDWDCERGEGPVVSQEIILPEFESFSLNGSGTVYLTQGEEQEVIIEGQSNIIDLIRTRVYNGHWDIEFSDCIRHHGDLKFFITLPYTSEININGSGKVISQNILTGDQITTRINGSGDVDLGVDVDHVKSNISGSGSVFLEGLTATSDFKITGSGKVHAFDLLSAASEIRISGSGDAEVNVLDQLEVNISGSGDVRYKGTAAVQSNISGSGKIVKVN